jgi:hypothetical protein
MDLALFSAMTRFGGGDRAAGQIGRAGKGSCNNRGEALPSLLAAASEPGVVE